VKWWRLAAWLLAREGRSGEWRVLVLALAIGVGSVSTTGFLGDRLHRAMTERGAEFLGADVLVASPRPIERWPAHDLKSGQALEFASMLAFGDAYQLAAVRAVDGAYPVRGEVRIAAEASGEGAARPAQPGPGEVFVDSQLLPLLGARIGDRVEIGVAEFRIAGVVTEEPGRAGAVFGLAPRVFMRLDEVDRTQVVQPGSRLTYYYLFAGTPEQSQAFSAAVKPTLDGSQRLLGGREGSEAVSGAFAKTDRFIGLAALVSLLLSALAVSLAARRYAARHYDQAALLRCFGVTTAQLRLVYGFRLAALGLIGSAMGVAVGAAMQQVLLRVLMPELAGRLPELGWLPAAAGVASGLVALAGAATPALLRLATVPPLRVLRRDLPPLPLSAWVVVLFGGGMLTGLSAWYAGDWTLAGYFVTGLAGLAVGLAALSQLALAMGRLVRRMSRGPVRFGLAQMLRHRTESTLQLGAFALTLFLMGSVVLIRSDLVDNWRRQLPENAPNFFLVNIAPEQNAAVGEFLSGRGLTTSRRYPMVRGRLVSKNGEPILQAVPAESRDYNALRRELNLTWSAELPAANEIVAGDWHGQTDEAVISVESDMAETLQLRLGDRLGFRIGERETAARIGSIRDVQWDSMQPNFYVIFPPGRLDDFPANYIASLHIPEASRHIVPAFIKAFPTVTVIALDKVIEDVQAVLEQVAAAVELLLGFLLLAGVAVAIAALLSSLDERKREAVLLRTLGAQKSFLNVSLLSEFLLLGLLAGLLAAVCTEATMSLVSHRLFELPPRLHPWVWWAAPVAGASLLAAAGWFTTRRIARVTPMRALRMLE
jgi:putative ABC transport system permease protein